MYSLFKEGKTLGEVSSSKREDYGHYIASLIVKIQANLLPLRLNTGYLGLGQYCQVDDLVVIFAGVTRPCVLQPVAGNISANETGDAIENVEARIGSYRLVGMAYIDGVMDGEFVAKDPPFQSFRLI
jgi:hypothetical protein